ncbi:MAG: OmpA family protein [Chitinophagales bacterium]|nr:OmpA family protein [Chitinophagales bacterium]
MKKRVLVTLFFCWFFLLGFSQTKQEVLVNEAIGLYGLGRIDEAFKSLDDCIAKYPSFDQAIYIRANWSVIAKKYEDALPLLEKLESVNPKFNPQQKKLIAETYFYMKNYDKAEEYIQEFLRTPNLSAQGQMYGQRMIKNLAFVRTQTSEVKKVVYYNLGPEVNSTYSEYFPSTNGDESAIYFTRRDKQGEDIWLSYAQGNKWSTAYKIDEPELENETRYVSINTFDNDGAHTITAGGRQLLFTSCQRPGGLGSCDLYIAYRKGEEWGKPKLLPTVNTRGWESQPCMSADGKKLYFVSSREGGVGESDIYMSELTSEGFSTPINLGPKVNSIGAEDRPFIHPDGQTLYFSSDAHPGYGGKDLFMSRFENGEWQTPVNLGPSINSIGDEISIFINTLGNKAYIAKENNENNRSDFDIYSFELPKEYRPKTVTYIKGIISNAKTGQPLKASVKLTDIAESKQISTMNSDEKSGDFLLTVVADKEYGFHVLKEGYAIYSQNYSFSEGGSRLEPQVLEIKMMPLEAGTKFELRNVFFETAKFDLKTTSYPELNYIVDILKTNPSLNILIAGHTDNIGNTANNQTLSENRAKAVMNYLIEKGIPAERLSAKGYGASKPIQSNETEEGRAKNRRTEIEIL